MMEERDNFFNVDSTENKEYKRFGIKVDKIDVGLHSGCASLMISMPKSVTYSSILSSGESALDG